MISRHGTTAQIDPLRFCRWLLQRCEERGVRVLRSAQAVAVLRDGEDVVEGVRTSQGGEETDGEMTLLVIVVVLH